MASALAGAIFLSHSKDILLKRFIQHVVHLVVLQLLLELVGLGVLVDLDVLNAHHLSEVFPVLLGDVVREGAVVCTACEDPGTGTNLEGGLGYPEGRSHRQVRHGLGLDALHLLRNQAEAVAKVNDCSLDTMTGLRGEHQTGGLLLADTDAEEVNLEFGLVAGNERTDLEHVALQTRRLTAGKVEGVVLEE